MKKLKAIVAITILVSILCGYCCLIGVTVNNYNKDLSMGIPSIEQMKEFIDDTTQIRIIAEESILEQAQAEEEDVEEIIYTSEPIKEEIKEIIKNETIVNTQEIESQKDKYVQIISSISEEEKELICRITFREAGNQSAEGQRAVIEVILNRMIDEAWPNTIEGVLSQPGQFSTWAGRDDVTSEQIENIYNLFAVMCEEDPVLNGKYVYFDGKQHSYGRNYVKIQDHWFGTR